MTLDSAISIVFLVVFATTAGAALWGRWRHKIPLGLGIRGVPVGSDVWVGAAIGVAGIAFTTVLMAVTGHVRSAGFHFDLHVLLLALLVLTVAAVVEELAYRVLMLGGFLRLTGSVAAALVVSTLVFGLVHLTDSTDSSVVSLLSNTMGGLMYAVAFVRTGRIWMAMGVHFAWNFAQGTVLGFVISGDNDYSGALWHLRGTGRDWLGGGGYGLEGSVFSLAGRALILVLLVWATRHRRTRLTTTRLAWPSRRRVPGGSGRSRDIPPTTG